MSVTVLVTHARSSFPGGRPWVELARFLIRSFQRASAYVFVPFDHGSTNSPSMRPRSISASRVWKPRFIAALVRRWLSGVRAQSRKRSESRPKSSAGAMAIPLTRSLIAARPAEEIWLFDQRAISRTHRWVPLSQTSRCESIRRTYRPIPKYRLDGWILGPGRCILTPTMVRPMTLVGKRFSP